MIDLLEDEDKFDSFMIPLTGKCYSVKNLNKKYLVYNF